LTATPWRGSLCKSSWSSSSSSLSSSSHHAFLFEPCLPFPAAHTRNAHARTHSHTHTHTLSTPQVRNRVVHRRRAGRGLAHRVR
jgi:hypothetical protein